MKTLFISALCAFCLIGSASTQAQAPRRANNTSTDGAATKSRPRVVGNQETAAMAAAYQAPDIGRSTRGQTGLESIRLAPIQAGDDVIRGASVTGINELIVEIRTNENNAGLSRSQSGSVYSHTTQVRPSTTIRYRVVHVSPPGQQGEWQFTVRLPRPLIQDQDVRALASGSNSAVTPWLKVSGGTMAAPAVPASRSAGPLGSQPLAVSKVDRPSQERANRRQPQRVTEGPELGDPCAGDPSLRTIYVDWETKNISPSRLKHSGNYCVIVSNANTILYSYAVRVESEEVQGNPLDLLNIAIGALKNIGGSSTGTPAPAKTPDANDARVEFNRRPAHTCELPPLVEQVKHDASDLQQAFAALLPEETGGKIPSIKLETTRKAWDPIPEKFNSLAASSEALRLKLSTAAGVADCSADQIKAATDIVGNYYKVRAQYQVLLAHVNAPPVVKVRADELDAADKIKVTVKEFYGGRQSAAETLTLNVSPGYSQISASAGFLVTQLPGRSYSSRTAPNPANLTTTQNVLGVDYGAGMRPALTALIHYNLPFIRQNRFGLALSAGPVYDISGGKADTSKFGFFGGVSARFSQWLYVTPGFHVGEFADFPEGFTRNGQVIPDNTGTPVPVKRYTTRFALAVTFKVKDLGASTPPTQ